MITISDFQSILQLARRAGMVYLQELDQYVKNNKFDSEEDLKASLVQLANRKRPQEYENSRDFA